MIDPAEINARPHEVVAINDRTGIETLLTDVRKPLTLAQAYTVRSKFTPHKSVRLIVREVTEWPKAATE